MPPHAGRLRRLRAHPRRDRQQERHAQAVRLRRAQGRAGARGQRRLRCGGRGGGYGHQRRLQPLPQEGRGHVLRAPAPHEGRHRAHRRGAPPEAAAAPHPLPSRHPRYPYPRAPIRHLPPLVRSVARSSPLPSPRCPSSPPTTTAAPERWLGGEWPWALGALGVAWVVSARVALAHGPRGMEGSRARVEYAAVGGTAALVASAKWHVCAWEQASKTATNVSRCRPRSAFPSRVR